MIKTIRYKGAITGLISIDNEVQQEEYEELVWGVKVTLTTTSDCWQ